jgi:hypothetical protein
MSDTLLQPIAGNNTEFTYVVKKPSELFDDLKLLSESLKLPINLCKKTNNRLETQLASYNSKLENSKLENSKISTVNPPFVPQSVLVKNKFGLPKKSKIIPVPHTKDNKNPHSSTTIYINSIDTSKSTSYNIPQTITCILIRQDSNLAEHIFINYETIIEISKSRFGHYKFTGRVFKETQIGNNDIKYVTEFFPKEQVLEIITELIQILKLKESNLNTFSTTCSNIRYFFSLQKIKVKSAGSTLRKSRKPSSRKHKKRTHRRTA